MGTDVRVDLREDQSLAATLAEITGIIHLAAVSRVAAGERYPLQCWDINVRVTRRLLNDALTSARRPWFVYASSREVYGTQPRFPVAEGASKCPINTYARTKVEGERLVQMAREVGLRTAILRFSNVYGDTLDYVDRVVPAFSKAASRDGVLIVRGASYSLDLIHADDAAKGVAAAAAALSSGERGLPETNLASGVETTIRELAGIALRAGSPRAEIVESAPDRVAVRRFCGDPSRAKAVLGWRPKLTVEEGVPLLVRAYANEFEKASLKEPAFA
jgi:nucleoside-diphosphate-sugar epimerase